MRKLMLAILLGMVATTSFAQTPTTNPTNPVVPQVQPAQIPPDGVPKRFKEWSNASRNFSGVVVKARVGESETKMQEVQISSPTELKVPAGTSLTELTIDYKGRALWFIYNEGITSRSGVLDGQNVCIISTAGLSNLTIRVAVIGVVNNDPALLVEYHVIIGTPDNKPPIVPVVPDVIKPPDDVSPDVKPDPLPNPVFDDLVDKLQDAADLDIQAKKITGNTVLALQTIYSNAGNKTKMSIVDLYKWLGEQYTTADNAKALLDSGRNLRTAINGVLSKEISPFHAKGANLTDADWSKVKAVLRGLSDALGKIKIEGTLSGTLSVVFVSNKDTITIPEAKIRASQTLRTWLTDNGFKSEFLYLENKFVKDKMPKIIEKYKTPMVMIINDKGQYKAFPMPNTEEEVIKMIKEKTGK